MKTVTKKTTKTDPEGWPLPSGEWVARYLYRSIQLFRELDEVMPAQTMQVFLTVAAEPDVTMARVAELCGISQSSVSRNVSALGKFHRKGRPGLDLVYAYEDPMERRRKLVRLTTRGEQLMRALRDVNHDHVVSFRKRGEEET